MCRDRRSNGSPRRGSRGSVCAYSSPHFRWRDRGGPTAYRGGRWRAPLSLMTFSVVISPSTSAQEAWTYGSGRPRRSVLPFSRRLVHSEVIYNGHRDLPASSMLAGLGARLEGLAHQG